MNKLPNPTAGEEADVVWYTSTEEKKMPYIAPKEEKTVKVNGGIMIAVAGIITAIGIFFHFAVVNTYATKIANLRHTTAYQEGLIVNNNLNIVPDKKLVKWAYKNSKPFIPKDMVVDILKEASKYDNYLMMLAVFKEESSFYVFARSEKQAKGLGQIMTRVWRETLVEEGIWDEEIDVFDYKRNIAATDYVINTYYKSTGSWREALLRYVGGDPKYVDRVLSNYAELKLLSEVQK